MEKEFVPYELAVKLKAFGFDEPCFGAYHNQKLIDIGSEYSYDVKAPLFQQAFRWFREKFELHFYTYKVTIPNMDDDYPSEIWVGKINDMFINTKNGLAINHFHNHEEAELACLENLIEIVKHELNKSE